MNSETANRAVHRLLIGAVVAGSLITLLAAVHSLRAMLVVPTLALFAVVGVGLLRRPLMHLCVVLALSVCIISYQEGIQWYEALYGLYFFSYLGAWALHRVVVREEVLIRDGIDLGLVLLLVYSTLTLVMTVLFGGDLSLGVREWASLALLGFVLPVRRATEEDPRALRWISLTFALVATFVLFRNLLWYVEGLQRAEYLWQIATGRVRMNENFLMVTAIGFVSLFAHAQGIYRKAVLIAVAAVFMMGVVVGQSRAVWVAMLLGLGVVFFAVGRREKIQLALVGSASFAAVVIVGAIVLDDFFEVVVFGLFDRIASLSTAMISDLSLRNRFVEWRAVWPRVFESPLIGHGFGTEIHFFNIINRFTEEKSHIHNTYLSFLFHHGVIGLSLLLIFVGSVMSRSIKALRTAALTRLDQAILVGAMSALVSLGLAAMTESLLSVNDGVLVIMFTISLCIGVVGRYRK